MVSSLTSSGWNQIMLRKSWQEIGLLLTSEARAFSTEEGELLLFIFSKKEAQQSEEFFKSKTFISELVHLILNSCHMSRTSVLAININTHLSVAC